MDGAMVVGQLLPICHNRMTTETDHDHGITLTGHKQSASKT